MPKPPKSRYPLLEKALAEGRIGRAERPQRRGLRCGPWDEREDGAMVCRKCGDVEPRGSGPFGF